MKQNPETIIQRDIIKWLELKGLFFKRERNQNFRNTAYGVKFLPSEVPGYPDISGVLPNGRAYFIEVKTKTGRLSDVQKQTHEDLRANGALVIVARSLDDLKELEDALNECLKQGLKPKASESLAVLCRKKHEKMLSQFY